MSELAPELTPELAPGVHKATDEGVLGTWRGLEVGVWEAAPGVETDTEADEVFVVLEGRATVEFTKPALPAMEIGPGDVVRLEEGMETVWTVHEHLRKVYLS